MTVALLVLLAAPPAPATLVLPFDPVEANPEHVWVGPAASELLARGLAVAGVPVAGRAERLRAQAALELPQVSLTRATSLRIAEALGANRLVTGTYAVRGAQLTLSPNSRSQAQALAFCDSGAARDFSSRAHVVASTWLKQPGRASCSRADRLAGSNAFRRD